MPPLTKPSEILQRHRCCRPCHLLRRPVCSFETTPMGQGGLGSAQEGTQKTQLAAVQAGLKLGHKAAND